MAMLSLIHDLGITPNEGTGIENDPNLQQGQQFGEYSRLYAADVQPRLTNLQGQNTMQGQANVGSITDALQSGVSAGNRKNHTFASGGNISESQIEFEQTLAKYTSLHKIYSEEILNQNIRVNDSLIRNVNLGTPREKMERIKSLNLKLQDLTYELLSEIDKKSGTQSAQQLLPQKSTLNDYLVNFQEENDQLNKAMLDTRTEVSAGPSAAAQYWFLLLMASVFMLLIYYVLADQKIVKFIGILILCLVAWLVWSSNFFK